MDDPYLPERVREMLAHDRGIAELNIDVRVLGERVFLSGHVLSAERRDAIGAAVSRLLPDFEVCNEVTAGDLGEPEDVETV